MDQRKLQASEEEHNLREKTQRLEKKMIAVQKKNNELKQDTASMETKVHMYRTKCEKQRQRAEEWETQIQKQIQEKDQMEALMRRAIAREQDLSTKFKEESYFRDLLTKVDRNGDLPDAKHLNELCKQLDHLDKSISYAAEITSSTFSAILHEEKAQVQIVVNDKNYDKPRRLQMRLNLLNPDSSMLADTSRLLDTSQHDVVNFNRLDKSASPSSSFISGMGMRPKDTLQNELGQEFFDEGDAAANPEDEIVEYQDTSIINQSAILSNGGNVIYQDDQNIEPNNSPFNNFYQEDLSMIDPQLDDPRDRLNAHEESAINILDYENKDYQTNFQINAQPVVIID